MLDILNRAMGEHRPKRDSATLNSLLRVIKVGYLTLALFHSLEDRIKSRQRFALVESGGTALPLPWLIAHTKRRDT